MLQQQIVQKEAPMAATKEHETSSKGAGTVKAPESGKHRGKQPTNLSKTPHVKVTTALGMSQMC